MLLFVRPPRPRPRPPFLLPCFLQAASAQHFPHFRVEHLLLAAPLHVGHCMKVWLCKEVFEAKPSEDLTQGGYGRSFHQQGMLCSHIRYMSEIWIERGF